MTAFELRAVLNNLEKDVPVNLTIELNGAQYAAKLEGVALKTSTVQGDDKGIVSVELYRMEE